MTAALVLEVAKPPAPKRSKRTGVVAARTSSDSAEWYTPREYIEAARRVLGEIDFDPASCAEANLVVKASKYFTAKDDGFRRRWLGRTWMNPPYGLRGTKSNQAVWTLKLRREVAAGRVPAAIALVNAETASTWFQPLWEAWVCLTDHRIRFWNEGEAKNQPTHGNAFVYYGPSPELFVREFSRFGRIVPPQIGGTAQGMLL